jgi:hypothetical protein
MSNLSLQSLLQSEPAPRPPVTISFDTTVPWKVWVNADAELADASVELYGVDLSAFFEVDDGFMSVGRAAGRVRIAVFADLLKPQYASEFHALMEAELDKDVTYVERKLLETWVDDDDESRILGRVRWWSDARTARDRNGVLYFDRLLGRLESDRYYTDYLVTESASSSYLSLLHNEIEDDAGLLVSLIANSSERFGGYRPTTLLPGVTQATDSSELLVKRVTDALLDRMVGFTSGSDERGIVRMVTALPGNLQSRVLTELGTRTSERTFKVLSRTGEQDAEGMLYFLFEDLEEDDRRRMGEDLQRKGVLRQDAIDSLVEGRTWAGRNLPWSTRHGQNAATFWANEFNETDSKAYGAVSATLGGFASLWTPETAGTTIVVLATANPSGLIGTTVARAPLVVQKGLLVVGTGVGAYQATTATMAAARGEEGGRELSGGERVGKEIEAVSTLMLLGVGFHTAGKMRPRGPIAPETALAPIPEMPLASAQPAASGSQQRVAWRVMSETAEGEITAVGLHHETGEMAVLKINKHTGDGSVFSPRYGRIGIAGGQPVSESLALGSGEPPVSGSTPLGPDTALLPPRAPAAAGVSGGGTPLSLPGASAPAKLPPPVAPLELGAGASRRMLMAPQYEDIGVELQQHIADEFGAGSGELVWSVGPDGTTFATPPLPNVPLYFSEGVLPPGQFFGGRPRVPVLAGPLKEGFTPFDVFPGSRPTTRSLPQVRATRGGNKVRGSAGEKYVAESSGGQREVTTRLPADMTRRTDLRTRVLGGTLDQEVKTYLRYVGGNAAVANEVAPSAFLRTEITRDAMMMHYFPDHQSVWVFIDAPPSATLAAELSDAGIAYVLYSDRVPYLP